MKKIKLNRELRTRNMVIRYHLLWVLFYALLLIAAGIFAYRLYDEHKEDRLPAGYIDLEVSKTKYQVGEDVVFTVINRFPTDIYVANNCPGEPLDVYTWKNKKWQQIHATAKDPDSVCYEQDRRVEVAPNSSITYHYKHWPDLFKEPGVYRIAMRVDHYDEVPFQDFVVLKPAEVITNSTQQSINQSANTPTPASNDQNQTVQVEGDDEKDEPNEVEIENDDD